MPPRLGALGAPEPIAGPRDRIFMRQPLSRPGSTIGGGMKAKRRKPTYGAATRLARLVLELAARPFGWGFESAERELGVSARTLLRYVAACRDELVDWSGKPIIVTERHGSRRVLRLAEQVASPESTAYEAVFLYFMLTVFRFLEGTAIVEGIEGLWQRLYKNLPQKQKTRLADFERKFFAIAYAPKDYRQLDEVLDLVLRSLIDQYRLRVDYAGLRGEGKVHELDPYTLAAYRGGLYLIGYSHLYEKIIWLAVERIRAAERMNGEDGAPIRFVYPREYSPEEYTNGMFGVFEGEETAVEILLRSAETEAFLRARTIHPTQRFTRRRDGKTVLAMNVRGTTELANWILGLGPWVEVLKPAELRDRIGRLVGEAAAIYAGTDGVRDSAHERRQ
jgi:predicted DNA-binding transcriptional regulator YafY